MLEGKDFNFDVEGIVDDNLNLFFVDFTTHAGLFKIMLEMDIARMNQFVLSPSPLLNAHTADYEFGWAKDLRPWSIGSSIFCVQHVVFKILIANLHKSIKIFIYIIT